MRTEGKDWEFESYTPDVVIISPGQNDGIQDSAVFCSEYVDFIVISAHIIPMHR